MAALTSLRGPEARLTAWRTSSSWDLLAGTAVQLLGLVVPARELVPGHPLYSLERDAPHGGGHHRGGELPPVPGDLLEKPAITSWMSRKSSGSMARTALGGRLVR